MPRLASLAFVVLLLAACGEEGSDTPSGWSPVLVVATTSQIGALVEEVAGDTVPVRTLIAPGVDPHDYEPSPQDVRDIGDATLVLRHGMGLDEFLDDVIEGAGARQVVTVTEGIEGRAAQHEDEDEHGEEHEDEHDEHGDVDPHVWHDPANVKVMTANVVEALAESFPDYAEEFRARGDAYVLRLDEVDAEIRAIIDEIPAADRRVVTDHDAFGYFLDRYGLELVGTVIPGTSTQAEASAQEIAALEDVIEAAGVKAIFSESSVDPKVARQIAEDTGVTIVEDLYGDSLGEPGSGAETIDGMLLFNAHRIADALK